MDIVLYHYWRSSASWRVRWGLELKKIPHKKIAVDLLSSEEKQEVYLEKNPAGYLPCLMVGERPLAESLSILEWLEENYPVPSFFAGDSFRRATIRQLAETINAGTQPLQNLDVMRRISDDKTIQSEWTRHWILRGLGVYESILRSVDRQGMLFSVSTHPTLADLCLIPQCYSALRFQIDLSAFPICKSIYEYALSTPECAAAHPDAFQPNV
ncbi:MAG: maleylacetoacetate isomerase [Bdellovibrionota bacterium]